MLSKSRNLSFILLSYIIFLGISQTFTGIVAPSAKPPVSSSSRVATRLNRGKKAQLQTELNTVDEGNQNRSKLIKNNRQKYSFSVIISR